MSYSSPPPARTDPYRRGAVMLAILSLMSLGTSNLIGSLSTNGRVPIQWVALASLPIVLGAAWFTNRRSLLAYRIGAGVWLISALGSLLLSVLRPTSGLMLVANVVFVIIITRFLSDTHTAMRTLPASNGGPDIP